MSTTYECVESSVWAQCCYIIWINKATERKKETIFSKGMKFSDIYLMWIFRIRTTFRWLEFWIGSFTEKKFSRGLPLTTSRKVITLRGFIANYCNLGCNIAFPLNYSEIIEAVSIKIRKLWKNAIRKVGVTCRLEEEDLSWHNLEQNHSHHQPRLYIRLFREFFVIKLI